MMRKYILIVCSMIAGCAPLVDYETLAQAELENLQSRVIITPSVDEDGVQTFGVTAWNRLPIYSAPGETISQAHTRLIAVEMARQKYCMNGYTISPGRVALDNIFYTGACK